MTTKLLHKPELQSLISDKVMAGLAAYVVDGTFSEEGIREP